MCDAFSSLISGSDLTTYDPYDLWKTEIGCFVKNIYRSHKLLGLIPAGTLAIFDIINNNTRFFCNAQEYPIVRAWATLILVNHYKRKNDKSYLTHVIEHLSWLYNNSCEGYSGHCWGLGFNYLTDNDVNYDSNTPLATMTPYALEAFVKYREISQDPSFDDVFCSIYNFFVKDIKVLEETDEYMITSYSPVDDRRVVNAASYYMYSLSLLIPYIDNDNLDSVLMKIQKLYAFLVKSQNSDGSWYYSVIGKSFIDCFHSCIVIKNIIKTSQILKLEGSQLVVENGYRYLIDNFFVTEKGLFKRFSKNNKPNVVKFDLYDNAEMLNLGFLLNDRQLIRRLSHTIECSFCEGDDIYSQIDVFGFKRNKNMLRWAVMPYLFALSELDI